MIKGYQRLILLCALFGYGTATASVIGIDSGSISLEFASQFDFLVWAVGLDGSGFSLNLPLCSESEAPR
jgi:hypothetical protein